MSDSNKVIKVCIAGATGWAGSALGKGVMASENMLLISGVSRSNAGNDLANYLGLESEEIPIYADVQAAMESPCDVFVEYTNPGVAKSNVLTALQAGCNIVIGTSGLTELDYREIEETALAHKKSVLAVGNFAITAVLMQKFSEMAARHIPSWEIIDYANAEKRDAPSGTARELAHRLGQIGESERAVKDEDFQGLKESRGARLDGSQVHAVRLPGYVISVETLFGMNDEKLIIRHEAGSSAEPYVQGGLLAIKKVSTFVGLRRGLDSVMNF